MRWTMYILLPYPLRAQRNKFAQFLNFALMGGCLLDAQTEVIILDNTIKDKSELLLLQ